MASVHWLEVHPAEGSALLRRNLAKWGFECIEGPGEGTLLLVADRPESRLIPPQGTDIIWWVRDAAPEEVSSVLARRPGWVVRQASHMEAVKEAILHLQNRDLGSEGWLRQMLHLVTLDELLRLLLMRAVEMSSARGGAVWVRQEEAFFQRIGEGFPEAPIPLAEASALVRRGEAWLLCPDEQMGILRLLDPKGDPAHFLGWVREVEDLLMSAWNLEKSQALSFKDDLTVAQNRRCLEVELPQAVREAASHGESVALIFLDVDNLKALNSQFGHPMGSKVLVTVAREAQRIIRTQDRLYRYGGDEFCLLIPGATAAGASKLGERLLRVLMNTPVRIGDREASISISVGIAAYPAHADGAEKLVERADRALFQAKAAGKGRVVIAG